MTDMNLTVADGMVVNLDFTLRPDDGRVSATSEGQGPLVFLKGQGQIMRGFGQAHQWASNSISSILVTPRLFDVDFGFSSPVDVGELSPQGKR